jgi:pyruvate dehydrogenase E2 component (dihydrolipoamide acetyltransferase)
VAHPIRMPSMSMYMAEGTLVAWLRPPDAPVESGEPVAEIETEKASFELEAPTTGRLHPVAAVGTTLPIEALLGYILSPGEVPPPLADPTPPLRTPSRTDSQALPSPPAGAPAPGLRATPIARRLAAEHGVELDRLTGSGPGGRIVEADVLAAVQRPTLAAPAWKLRRRIPLAGLRRTITDRLLRGLAVSIPLTLTREIRVDALVAARQRLAARIGSISFDALFIKLLAASLRDCPELNAVVEDDAILELDEVHVGFAVAVPEGVVVPVVREADTLPLGAVVGAVRELSQRARTRRLQPKDTGGGTITITNLGGQGIDAFTPVLNPPQAAILGIGRIAERPVIEGGRILPAWTCILSLTFDHRVTDGVPAGQLLAAMARRAADPAFLDELSGESTAPPV